MVWLGCCKALGTIHGLRWHHGTTQNRWMPNIRARAATGMGTVAGGCQRRRRHRRAQINSKHSILPQMYGHVPNEAHKGAHVACVRVEVHTHLSTPRRTRGMCARGGAHTLKHTKARTWHVCVWRCTHNKASTGAHVACVRVEVHTQ